MPMSINWLLLVLITSLWLLLNFALEIESGFSGSYSIDLSCLRFWPKWSTPLFWVVTQYSLVERSLINETGELLVTILEKLNP